MHRSQAGGQNAPVTISADAYHRRVFIHVGSRKTGTSYLQKSIYESADELAAGGLHLPLADRGAHYRMLQALGGIFGDSLGSNRADSAFAWLTEQLADVAAPTSLLTFEDLAASRPAQIDRLLSVLDRYQVHVIITSRDLARQLPSEWQQCVKERMTLPYGDFLTDVRQRGAVGEVFWARQDAADIAARWGAGLPSSQVHVVTVPPSGASHRELPARFCRVVGIDPQSLHGHGGANPSLGAAQAELLRRVNVALGDRLTDLRGNYRQVVRRYLSRQLLGRQDGRPLTLPVQLADWCREESGRIADCLRERGYDVVGDLDDLMPVAPAGGGTDAAGGADPTGVTDSEITQVAIEVIAAMLDQRHRDHKDLHELQQLRAAAASPEPVPPRGRARLRAPGLRSRRRQVR